MKRFSVYSDRPGSLSVSSVPPIYRIGCMLFIFIAWFHSNRLSAQTASDLSHDAANILPPSPTASELGKYGLAPIGLVSGSASVSIPVYTYQAGKISVPISLSYSANGLKVDQLASWVGMNFSLNAGGVITRIIRDEADDDVNYTSPPYPTSYDAQNVEFAKYLEAAGQDNFDSEQDLYSFNFLQYTGKFVFDRSGNIIVMPFQNIKIDRYVSDDNTSYFQITTPDGVKFTFDFTELSKSSSSAGCGKSYYSDHISSWYLTKIEHPAGDVVNFDYTPIGYTYSTSISQVIMVNTMTYDCYNGTKCPVHNDRLCVSNVTTRGGVLTKISSPSYGTVEFSSSNTRTDVGDAKLDRIECKDSDGLLKKAFAFNYVFTTSNGYSNSLTDDDESLKHRMFLTQFDEQDDNSVVVRSHSFQYNDFNNLPPRLSFSQDFWGYFNGAPNTVDFVPNDPLYDFLFGDRGADRKPNGTYSQKGLLSRIVYPTGGTTTITYEPNAVWNEHPPVTTPTTATFNEVAVGEIKDGDVGDEHWPSDNDPIIINDFTDSRLFINVTVGRSDNFPDQEIDPLHHIASLTVKDVTLNTTVYQLQSLGVGSYNEKELFLTIGHSYSISLTAYGSVVRATVNGTYYNGSTTSNTSANVETGGVRVSKVVNEDPFTNKTEQTTYSYAYHDTPSQSSGINGPQSVFYQTSTVKMLCGTTPFDCDYASLNSSSLNNLYPMGGNNIYYQFVMVSKGTGFENGVEEHEYLVQFDSPGKVIFGDDIVSGSYSNFAWGNGVEKAVKNYTYKNGTWIPVHTKVNNYLLDARNQQQLANMIVRKKYDNLNPQSVIVDCNEQNREKVYKTYYCIADHGHVYEIGGWPWSSLETGTHCIAPGHNNEWVVIGYHPCYHNSADQVVVTSQLENLDAVEYQNIAYWFYIQSTTETIFDTNGENPVSTTKEFVYNNPEHGFVSQIKTTGSDQIDEETDMWYPQDYGAIENLPTLISSNILDVPINTEKYRDGALVSGTAIKLNDIGLTTEIYSFESLDAVSPTQHSSTILIPANYLLKESFTYDLSTNKLTETQPFNNHKVSYLWGYNNRYPVAEIKNASIADVAYTSFESGTTGSWQFAGAPSSDESAPTGVNSYDLSLGNIQRTSLLPANTYLLSYYFKTGTSVTVTGGTVKQVTTSSYKEGWSFNQVKISGASTVTIQGNGAIDEVRLHPASAQMTTFTYISDVGVSTITDPGNIITFYEYDDIGRLKLIRDYQGNILKSYQYHYAVPGTSGDHNYVLSNDIQQKEITTETQVNAATVDQKLMTYSYVDGLGRPAQKVSVQQSPGQKDIVQPVVYDALGREQFKYLPYASLANDGTFKENALADQSNFYQTADNVSHDANPYSQTIFELSPLNRVIEQGAPGSSWQPDNTNSYTSTDHTIKHDYSVNGANEVILFTYDVTTGLISAGGASVNYYSANQLQANKTKDEHGNEMIEYVDKEGHTVCKKVQYGIDTATLTNLYASTYYIYDNRGQLVVVIPPEGVKAITSLGN